MRIKLDFGWEKLDATTARAKVIGGWLMLVSTGRGITSSFVSDKDHGWLIMKPYVEPEKNP